MKTKTCYWIARHILTGLYYSMSLGCGFVSREIDHATLLTARQAASVHAAYRNVLLVEVH